MFFNFGRDFCDSFSMLFPKAPASCYKKKFKLIFLIFQTNFKLEILILLSFVVSFLVDMFN